MTELQYTLGVMGLAWLMIVAAFAFLPYYTRKSISFGIAVPKEVYDSEFFSSLRQQYLWANLVLGAVLLCVTVVAMLRLPEDTGALVSVGLILFYTALSFVFYARAHNRSRDYKRASDWTISTTAVASIIDRDDTRKLFNPWWYLTYLILIGATAAASLFAYPSLPEMIPQQFDLAGNATTYATKSMGVILSMPLTQLAMTALFVGIGYMINRAKRQTDDSDVRQGLRNNRTFQIVMGKTMFWLGLAMQLMLSASQLSIIGWLSPAVILWATFALLAFIIVIVVYVTLSVGQGGYRLAERAGQAGKDTVGSELSEHEGVDDDSQWILWGTFYNNSEDPSIFVEKRVGVGWTTNVGHPIGKALVIATAILLVGLIVALPWLAATS